MLKCNKCGAPMEFPRGKSMTLQCVVCDGNKFTTVPPEKTLVDELEEMEAVLQEDELPAISPGPIDMSEANRILDGDTIVTDSPQAPVKPKRRPRKKAAAKR